MQERCFYQPPVSRIRAPRGNEKTQNVKRPTSTPGNWLSHNWGLLQEAQKWETVGSVLAVAKARGLSIDDVLRILDTQGKQDILEMLRK